MNLINLLVKLLKSAYEAEAKRAEVAASHADQLAEKFAHDAVLLAAKADARVGASKNSAAKAKEQLQRADALRSKGKDVAAFLEVK